MQWAWRLHHPSCPLRSPPLQCQTPSMSSSLHSSSNSISTYQFSHNFFLPWAAWHDVYNRSLPAGWRVWCCEASDGSQCAFQGPDVVPRQLLGSLPQEQKDQALLCRGALQLQATRQQLWLLRPAISCPRSWEATQQQLRLRGPTISSPRSWEAIQQLFHLLGPAISSPNSHCWSMHHHRYVSMWFFLFVSWSVWFYWC